MMIKKASFCKKIFIGSLFLLGGKSGTGRTVPAVPSLLQFNNIRSNFIDKFSVMLYKDHGREYSNIIFSIWILEMISI